MSTGHIKSNELRTKTMKACDFDNGNFKENKEKSLGT